MQCSILHKEIEISKNQKKTATVILITVIMMIAEIYAGLKYGSIALLSDGIHMGTHTLALLITLFAYIFARKHSSNEKFTFGTGKVGVLGGYSSAIALLIAATFMIWEAFSRLINPIEISFNQSLWVAVIGLVVNLVSALLLQDSHDHHSHDSQSQGSHTHKHEDHNLKAAYLHVVADALTSVLAIIALLAGKYFGAIWLDPIVGIAGAIVVIKWGLGLLKSTGLILLDYENDDKLHKLVIDNLESKKLGKVIDLHIWQVDSGQKAIICSIDGASTTKEIRETINDLGVFSHITVEVA